MKDDKMFANEESFELNPEMLDKVAGGAGMTGGKGFDSYRRTQIEMEKKPNVNRNIADTQFDTYGFLKRG